MKIALCLFGIVGNMDKHGLGVPVDFRIGHHFHKKHILDHNDVDVFIHSWSVEHADKLINLYEPEKAVFEEQINFKQDNLRANSIKSRWYSTKAVVELKSMYEREHGFKYDFVMIYRFDCMFWVDLRFATFDPTCFYASHRDDCFFGQCNCERMMRFEDMWFFGTSADINKFASLYDYWEQYGIRDPHSECVHHIYQMGLNERLRHVFYEKQDHGTIRTLFKNCEYDADNPFDVNSLELQSNRTKLTSRILTAY